MARPVLIANTPRASLRPLGAQGQTVAQAQQQVVAVIAANLTPRHAQLFAEPVADPARDQIAWYTTAEGGKAQRLADASPEAQQKAREAIGALADDIRKLAQGYTAAQNPQQRQLGQLIELAQSFPGEECVFLVGEQPVIVAWGYASTAASAAEPTTLTRYGVRPAARARGARAEADATGQTTAAATTVSQTVAARHASAPAWVLWILFLVAGLAVGSGIAWAIQAGPLPIVWTAGVPTVVSDPLADGRAAEAKLRQTIADLSLLIAQKQVQCTVPPAEGPRAPGAPPTGGAKP